MFIQIIQKRLQVLTPQSDEILKLTNAVSKVKAVLDKLKSTSVSFDPFVSLKQY